MRNKIIIKIDFELNELEYINKTFNFHYYIPLALKTKIKKTMENHFNQKFDLEIITGKYCKGNTKQKSGDTP